MRSSVSLPSGGGDDRIWSLESSGSFTVKSLSSYLPPSLMANNLSKAIRKSKSPKKINIFVWIMINGSFNSAEVLQRKNPTLCLKPSVC